MCFGLFFLLLSTVLAGYDLLAAASLMWPDLVADADTRGILAAVGQYIIAFPIGAILISRVPADPMEKKKLPSKDFFQLLLIACFLLIAGNLLGYGVNYLINQLLGLPITNPVEDMMNDYSLGYTLVFVVIAAPLWEEFIFRKLLIDRLNRLGDRPAMIISALLFGMFHGNFSQFFYAFAVGLLFGYIYLRTGRLRYTIVLHMFVNFFFGVLPVAVMQENSDFLLGIWAVLELGLAVAGLVMLIRRRKSIRLLRGWIKLPHHRWEHLAFLNPGMMLLLLACVGLFALEFVQL